jgi:hypothetical protein
LSLVGSVYLNNLLINFKYGKFLDENILKPIPGYTITKEIDCAQNLNTCENYPDFNYLKTSSTLGTCFENTFVLSYKVDGTILTKRKNLFIQNDPSKGLKPKFKNEKIQLIATVNDEKEMSCIKNHNAYKVYKLFPFYHNFIYKLLKHPKTELGSSVPINPFLNGEASISNIVKRFPINFIFKPLLYIGSILLILYWSIYNTLFVNVLNSKRNMFKVFGIISAISLFLHVSFLGVKFESEILSSIKRLFIIFFILFEVLAQYFLTLGLFANKKKLVNLCNVKVINFKVGFLILVIPISLVLILIMLLYDLSGKFHYLLEWNYFTILIFYYLLSYFMWSKKLIYNPPAT